MRQLINMHSEGAAGVRAAGGGLHHDLGCWARSQETKCLVQPLHSTLSK